MSEDTNILDELSKGSCMGLDALDIIMKKVKDKDFYKVLEKGYKDYNIIKQKIDEIYPKYSDKEPHETNAMNKAMTWYGIEIKTLTDESNSKIAELLLQGVNMGIIEGRKMLNNKKTNKEIKELINNYVKMQELFADDIKNYL